jgi:galactokinase
MGGCVVAVAADDTAAGIVAALDRDFYRPRGVPVEGAVFLTRPAGGASLSG